jgi:hypothetical protein
VGVLCFALNGNKTEFALNEQPDYKTYDERQKEQLKVNDNGDAESLPKIKSFK